MKKNDNKQLNANEGDEPKQPAASTAADTTANCTAHNDKQTEKAADARNDGEDTAKAKDANAIVRTVDHETISGPGLPSTPEHGWKQNQYGDAYYFEQYPLNEVITELKAGNEFVYVVETWCRPCDKTTQVHRVKYFAVGIFKAMNLAMEIERCVNYDVEHVVNVRNADSVEEDTFLKKDIRGL